MVEKLCINFHYNFSTLRKSHKTLQQKKNVFFSLPPNASSDTHTRAGSTQSGSGGIVDAASGAAVAQPASMG